ncbi:MAG: MmgE/PrpD family protein [Cryobacterium sp.]|nr:MmgE/PrpD family protein [Cryobacterium sp.]
MQDDNDVLKRLARHIATALKTPLPHSVVEKTSHHLLDTLAAMVSGSRMEPGEAGIELVRTLAPASEASVIGSTLRSDVMRAALANGMSAHADETDDSHELSLTHPGCAIVPAALAAAEKARRNGDELLAAIALGYDIATRITRALWSDNEVLRLQGHSTHAMGGLFGATAASAALLGIPEERIPYVVSYAAQEASGMRSWTRDVEHIEKAYVFGGMPASTGVWVSTLVAQGWSGVRNVLDGTYNLFETFGRDPRPETLVDGLGEDYAIIQTNIKRYCVGSPIQAPLDALLAIIHREDLSPEQIANASVRLPATLARVVDDREMPNINLQYLAHVAAYDRDVSFAAAHDRERFLRWRHEAPGPVVDVIRDEEMKPVRQAVAEITDQNGRIFSEHVTAVRGTADNPMTREEVEHKAIDLVEGLIGSERTDALIEQSRDYGAVQSVREITDLLAVGA